jgi:hypothetical protein
LPKNGSDGGKINKSSKIDALYVVSHSILILFFFDLIWFDPPTCGKTVVCSRIRFLFGFKFYTLKL